MIIKGNEKLKIREKTEEERVSQKGTKYMYREFYAEDKDGLVYKFAYIDSMIYKKAQIDKYYTLKYYINTSGIINLNDIEEVK